MEHSETLTQNTTSLSSNSSQALLTFLPRPPSPHLDLGSNSKETLGEAAERNTK